MPEFNDLRQISEAGNNAFRQGQAMTAQSQANALGQLQLQNAPREIAQGNRLTELKLRDAEAAPQKAIDEERKKIVMTVGTGMAKKMALAKDDAERAEIYMQGSKGLNQFLTENGLATPDQRAGVITPLEKMGGAQGFMALFSGETGGESLSQKEYDNALQALQPALDANGNIDESKLTAASRAAGIKLRLLPGAQGSAAITTALTPGLTGQVAGSNAVIAGATEGAKTTADLNARTQLEPELNAKIVSAKTLAEKDAENLIRAQSDAPALFNDLISAIEKQPNTAAGRGYEQAAGYVGAGDEAQQVAIAQADTIISQLMAYAEKLPGPASDADRIDFKASVGAYNAAGATKAQKLAAAKQAKKSFDRLASKYKSQIGKYTSSTGIQFEVLE